MHESVFIVYGKRRWKGVELLAVPIQEVRFDYKGYPCVVLFMPLGYRCGYVGLPAGIDIDTDMIGCHGGINYHSNELYWQEDEGVQWIGFDCIHAFDAYDHEKAREYYADNLGVINWIDSLEKTGFLSSRYSVVRSLEYVIDNLMQIVDQVIRVTGGVE